MSQRHAPAALRVCNSLLDKYPSQRPGRYPYQAAIDSGATSTFIDDKYRGRAHKRVDPNDTIEVECANTSTMVSTSTDELDLSTLPRAARQCDKFKNMSTSLISVKKLDESGLAVLFHNRKVKVINPVHKEITIPGKIAMQGKINPSTGLYMTDLHDSHRSEPAVRAKPPAPPTRRHHAHALTIRTVPALIDFYHITLGAPPISSWIKGIDNGWFTSWPGLTSARVRKYCANKPQTTYGHMQLLRQHVDSTKETLPYANETVKSSPTDQPVDARARSKHHYVETHIIETHDPTNMIALDITGRYPVTSRRGHKYVFVLLDRDTNYIYLVPMKSRKSNAIVGAYQSCYEQLVQKGYAARLLRLDNEISKELIKAIEDDKLNYQLASPHDHRNNPAESAINHAKAHFISVRACTDKDFDPCDWDLLLPQTEHTLNMLRPSRINPQVSAYTMVHGHHDFRRNPIAPAGCKVIVHERKMERGTWGDHGVPGYYLQMAPHHYRNVRCYIPSTHAFRVTNTVEYFPKCCEIPHMTPLDHIGACLQQLNKAITDTKATDLFQGDTSTVIRALHKLKSILGLPDQASTPAPAPPPKGAARQTSKGAELVTRSRTRILYPS